MRSPLHRTKSTVCRACAWLVFASFSGSARAQVYSFTTLAGNPEYPGNDAVIKNVRFVEPEGVAVDSSGNVYVTDLGNGIGTLRTITPGGAALTLLAGSAGFGVDDGSAGTAVRFTYPWSVAVSDRGDVFVAERDQQTITKITANGVVTTFAGKASVSGNADGIGSAARFNEPVGIALDRAGNLYVAEFYNSAIRKITPDQVVTTLAASAPFSHPTAIAVDADGTILVTDLNSVIPGGHPNFLGCSVRRLTPMGEVTTLAGSAAATGTTDGVGTAARFQFLDGLAVDGSGNVFVADYSASTIRKITGAGVVTTFAGRAGSSGNINGAGSVALFNSPAGLAFDHSGNLLVVDAGNNEIRLITAAGVVTTLAGSGPTDPSPSPGVGQDGTGAAARFALPAGIAADQAGNALVVDSAASAVRKITAAGVVTTMVLTSAGATDNTSYPFLDRPTGVAVDATGTLFVSDVYSVHKITPAGVMTTLAGSSNGANLEGPGDTVSFGRPTGIAVGRDGNVFVATLVTIFKVTPSGFVTILAGDATSFPLFGNADGIGRAARFNSATGVAVDSAGNVFVADSDNYTVRQITPGGVVTTVAGSAGLSGTADGVGRAARFQHPTGVAVDDSGNLFVADVSTIRKITPTGAVITIAGKVGSYANVDGTGSAAHFGAASAVAVDRNGNLYVADSGVKTIRLGVPLANPARLTNVSVLTALADGGETLSVGAIIGGAGTTGAKPLLVRAAGPALAAFGVPNPLADPRVAFFHDATKIGENDDWAGAPALSAVFAQVGAFPFASAASKDAALQLLAVPAGNNTLLVSENGAVGGNVLAEIYDATPSTAFIPVTPRLVNVSVLKNIGSVLTAGFIIGGQGAETVLIRAVGPSLAPFGVTGLLADPRLELFDPQGRSVATNDNWGDAGPAATAALSSAFAQVGAFELSDSASKDSALLVTLAPGSYTVQVRGANTTTGVALVEVYEVP